MNRDYSYLVNTLSSWNFSLSDKQIQQLDLFYELLVEKNKVMNLTAITEFDDVLVKHFADSLSICTVLPSDIKTVCDLGTGAGFPGIPMAIAYPGISFTLIENKIFSSIGSSNIENILFNDFLLISISLNSNSTKKFSCLFIKRANSRTYKW